jgi:tetratricopeptide (TPR) repeat protein
VVGPSLELALAAEIVGDAPVDAGDLERWHRLGEFLRWESSETLAFRHDLFRTVAYAGLSFRRRRQIHRSVAAALERRAAGEGEDAGLLSLHFLEGERYEDAWRYAVLAADRARERYANVVAAELYGRALAAAGHLPDNPEAEIARVAEALGDVTELYARYDLSQEAYETARRLVHDDPVTEARLLRKEGVLQERSAEYEAAAAQYEQALHVLESAAGPQAEEERIELELAYAGVRFRQGRHEDCRVLAELALEHAEAARDQRRIANACYLLDGALSGLGGTHGTEYLDRALAIYLELGDVIGQGVVFGHLGIHAYYAGHWEEAARFYRESRDAAIKAGAVVRAALETINQAEILSDQGLFDAAEDGFTDALRTFRAAGYAFGAAVVKANLGRLEARRGDFVSARRLLGEALAELEAMGSSSFAIEARARLAECDVLAGEHHRAVEQARDTLAEAGDEPAPLTAFLRRVAGLAALQGGDRDSAGEHLAESRRIAEEIGARYELALTLQAQAELARRGGPGDAEALAAESRALLDALGVVATPRIPLP